MLHDTERNMHEGSQDAVQTEWDIRKRSLRIVNTERDIHEESRGAVRTIHAGGHGIVNVDVKRVKMLYVLSGIYMKGASNM